jgi:hypothetical protein
MSDQATEQSVESRLASYFSADAGQPEATPEVANPEASASEETVEAPAVESDEPEQPEQSADSGYEELELDGETYRVPPKLREAVLRQSDYTRKTQEVAETARMLQAHQQQMQMAQQFQQATAQDQQALQQLESQLGQFKQLNWGEMDMETLTRARFQMDSLKEQADGVRNRLNGAAAQFQQMLANQRQQQLQQGLEYLRKAIPRFDADTVSTLRNYAVGEGFTQPEVESINDPRLVKLMWKAQQYDTLKASQKSAVEAVQKAPPMIKPGSTANQQTRATVRIKQSTERLKKTGSLDAFADALLARGYK